MLVHSPLSHPLLLPSSRFTRNTRSNSSTIAVPPSPRRLLLHNEQLNVATKSVDDQDVKVQVEVLCQLDDEKLLGIYNMRLTPEGIAGNVIPRGMSTRSGGTTFFYQCCIVARDATPTSSTYLLPTSFFFSHASPPPPPPKKRYNCSNLGNRL